MSTVDPTVKTSRAFAAALALYDRLCEQAWPAHPTTNEQPDVHLFIDPGWESGEYVSVVDGADDPSNNEWTSAGPATRQEFIPVTVLIRSMIHGQDDQRYVVERLADLADVAQGVTYDVATGKPKALDFTNEDRIGRASSVRWSIARTDTGFIGETQILFELRANI